MSKTQTYIISTIIIFTLCVIIYLIFKASELQQYVMLGGGLDISPLKEVQKYISIVEKLISSFL